MMVAFISGIAVGLLVFFFLSNAKAGLKEWALFIVGLLFVLFGFEVLIDSYAEHEVRAAWLGFQSCGVIGSVLIIIACWQGFKRPMPARAQGHGNGYQNGPAPGETND